MATKEVTVYLFMGFLEAGKTTFIQETMEDPRFDSGERTLLLVTEEGEKEYDPSRFAVKDFAVEYVEEKWLSADYLSKLAREHDTDRVVVEWNGMLPLEKFLDAMPDGWTIAQVMTFFEAPTFLAYNKNIRQLVFDKLQYTDMAVFNRFSDDLSQEEFHKTVRGVTRRAAIAYEYKDGKVVYDEIEDPLPFDIDADVVEISDRDYAFFYRDLTEDMEKYDGKVVSFKGMVAMEKKMKSDTIVVGRHVMTCCAADIRYCGLVVKHASSLPFETGGWVKLTARVDITYDKIYRGVGPVLRATSIEFCEPLEEELATFY